VEDPFLLIVVAAALFVAVWRARAPRGTVVDTYFWIVLALTAPVYASAGIDNNHLIDLLGASLLILGGSVAEESTAGSVARVAPMVLAGLTLLECVPGLVSIESVISQSGHPERAATSRLAQRAGPGDVLSEDPLLPILAGSRPFLLDAFSLRTMARERKNVGEDFNDRLSRGDFERVILVDRSGADRAHALAALRGRIDRGVGPFYGGTHFTPTFLEVLDQCYEVGEIAPPFVSFRRRERHEPPPSNPIGHFSQGPRGESGSMVRTSAP
jgi:hypothetical protein